MTFYSRNGKQTLAKIWREQDLDKDLVLSSWIGAPPSKNVILELVSEYMQNFIQSRNRRIMLMNHKLMLAHLPWKQAEDYIAHPLRSMYRHIHEFQMVSGSHQLVLNEILKERAKQREETEKQRIQRLILEGKLETPEGFKSAVLNLNVMDDKLKQLEKALDNNLQQKRSNVEAGIIPNHSVSLRRRRRSTQRYNNHNKGSKNEATYKKKQTNHSTSSRESPATVPSIITSTADDGSLPSVSVEIQIQSLVHLGGFVDESTCQSPVWKYIEFYDRSYDSDIDDMEIFTHAESHLYYRASGELEFEHTFDFPQELVLDLKDAKDCEQIYSDAEQVLTVFNHKLEAARNKLVKVNRAHFEKMFAASGPF